MRFLTQGKFEEKATPVVESVRVLDPSLLGIVAPVGTYTTFYNPGEQRNTNIQRIAEIVADRREQVGRLLLARRHRRLVLDDAGDGLARDLGVREVGEAEFRDLLREASEEISRQVATDILIIEDEPLIAMDIGLAIQHYVDPDVVPLSIYPEAFGVFDAL